MKRFLILFVFCLGVGFAQTDSISFPKQYPIVPHQGKDGGSVTFKISGVIVEETWNIITCGVLSGYSTIKIELTQVDTNIYNEKYMYLVILCYTSSPEHIGKPFDAIVSYITLDRDLKYSIYNTLNSAGLPFFYCEKRLY